MKKYSIFKKLGGTENVLNTLKHFLKNGVNLNKKFNILNITIQNHAILINYESDTKNTFCIYNDFSTIMGFIHGALAKEFSTQKIYNVGIQASYKKENQIYILSPIESVKAIAQGNAIYWLNNSIINKPLNPLKEVYVLVEGESELVAFPILFEFIGVNIEQHNIKLIPYSKNNLKTSLVMLKHTNSAFYLICDKDKEKIISDLKRENLLKNNCYVLPKGEFEDYIAPELLIDILKSFTPNIDINKNYIEYHRESGISTSKLIAKYYNDKAIRDQNPPKPDVIKKVVMHWGQADDIPTDFTTILNNILDIS
ncbi:hypothetical protein BegalDRAFT_2241 [Beggiatoa alba B18LD]|uniref:OLD protein-like TOPRIM domain-containing protein n=1 Tax=Beggiatoa alba B18LD TaxID=395493 RepID=I3CHK2_9GAMM|nr:TOPRIM nucleotidyl transferase/hydrolase domain-containing protein [Beggiatoa alba]EIJ43095.1 hypothetical protein BegalDRAFT_2241 [Beggiatoa alba B18LD]